MRRQVKVGVYQTKIPKIVWRTCLASRRNERGLGINGETALLPQWQWRFEVDRIQSRFASSIDMGPSQPARFLQERCLLPEGCRIALRGHGRGGKRRRGERAALSKMDAGMALLVREVGVALLLCFYSGRRDIMCICCLCFARAFTFSKSDASPQ